MPTTSVANATTRIVLDDVQVVRIYEREGAFTFFSLDEKSCQLDPQRAPISMVSPRSEKTFYEGALMLLVLQDGKEYFEPWGLGSW